MELNDYSFVLGNPRDQDAFLNQYQGPLADLGFSISFVDNNGKNFWAGADPVKKATTTGLLLYSAALLLSMALLVFLFLRQQRRSFAILRALGVPEKESTRQFLFPLVMIGALGTIAGGLSSWNYSLEKAADSLSRLSTPAGVMPSATLHPAWLVGLCLGVFALFLGFSWAGLRILTHKPVLAQLQEGTGTAGQKLNPAAKGAEAQKVEAEPIALSGNTKGSPLVRLTRRHILRSTFKSSLTLAVAMGFVLTLGWIRWNLERNQAEVERLYLTTLVQADLLIKTPESFDSTDTEPLRISRIFPRGLVDKLMETGLVKKVYLETITKVSYIKNEETGQFRKVRAHALIGCNDLRIAHLDYLKTAEFQFLPGYDEEIFTKEWTKEDFGTTPLPIILPEDILEADNLELGESVTWMDADGKTATYLIAATYTGGIYSTSEGTSSDSADVFHPIVVPLSILDNVSKYPLNYDVVKLYIDPVFNRNLEEVKEILQSILEEPGVSRVPLRLNYWDEELWAVVTPLEENLSLLELLYPLSAAAFVLLGTGLSILLVLLRAKETALLRMLGVSKTKVRIMLSLELLLLSLAGVLLGLGLLALLRQDFAAAVNTLTLKDAGLYLLGSFNGALIGALLVSSRKPLELLQVKE